MAVGDWHWHLPRGTGVGRVDASSAVPRSCAFGTTLRRLAWPLFTIACMLAIAFVTRYSGMDATLGLAFTRTGVMYPLFAAMLGWLGVALTGSDTLPMRCSAACKPSPHADWSKPASSRSPQIRR